MMVITLIEKVYSFLWGDLFQICLLYTSDAADEEDSVDLAGSRINNKKNKTKKNKNKEDKKNTDDYEAPN